MTKACSIDFTISQGVIFKIYSLAQLNQNFNCTTIALINHNLIVSSQPENIFCNRKILISNNSSYNNQIKLIIYLRLHSKDRKIYGSLTIMPICNPSISHKIIV